jgi:DNA-directed RNA polymerase II subunit RPB2
MENRFGIVSQLFRGTQDLIVHHIDSYERLIRHQIPQTLREISPINIPLVQKNKARVLSDKDQSEEQKEVEGVVEESATGAAKTKVEYVDEDIVNANTYSEYDAVVAIYLGGKTGTEINIHKPILYDNGNKTPLFPNDARLRGYSYTTTLTANITVRVLNINTGEFREETIENAPLIDLPVMVRSRACVLHGLTSPALSEVGEDPDDPGGYFIINGAERVLVTQERVIPNLAYVNSKPEVMMACSQPDNTKVKVFRLSFGKRGIEASVPGTKGLVPVCVLFRALNVISDKDIIRCIFGNDKPDREETDIIRSTLAAGHGIYDQHSAIRLLTHLSRGLTIASAHGILHKQLFTQQSTLPEKAAILGDLVRMLVHRKLDRIKDTDRDSTKNKSLAVSGTLMGEVFSNIIQTRDESIRSKISSEYNYNYIQYKDDKVFDLIPLIVRSKDDIFGSEENTSLLMRSMKGQWGADPERGVLPQADGVSQSLDRLTYTSALSHLRRVVLERVPDGKALLARRLHMSSYGYICPSETPSGGPKIGVVKNLAVLASVSAGVSSHQIRDLLYDIGIVPCNLVSYTQRASVYRVMLNGILLGYTSTPLAVREELLRRRRTGLLHPTVSIAHDHPSRLIWIGSGSGRLLRPLIRVKDGKPMIDEAIARFAEINARGGNPTDIFSITPFTTDNPVRSSTGESATEVPLELIDPWEMENLYVANYESEITQAHTHLEVHPSTIFGVMGCLIPFAPHNQGPRNIYSCAQSKQGTSVYSKAFLSRYDHSAMVLTSTQKPAVSTWYGRRIANGMLAYGTNLIVAIACFSGYNQEDGVLVNRTSVERGLFRVLKFSEEASQEENSERTNTQVRFKDPRTYSGIKLKEKADYSYLDSDGLLPEGTTVKPGMVLFGRIAEQEGATPRDVSLIAGKFAGGIIDSRVILRDSSGLRRVRYRIAKLRSPELGDKFSSRAGQKGTNGMLIAEVDMPRTAEGIVPDLVVNPHAIPSRITIGQLQEVIMGKLSCLLGCESDSTAFTQHGVFSDKISQMLSNAGYDPTGDETMYSGITGEVLHSKIFIGPTYYMRLKHMAQDKINYRGGGVERGPVDARTRQPVGGRAREGGLRIGEMERDSVLSYGASIFLQESLTDRADGEKAIICANTGKRGFYGKHGYRSVELDAPLPAGDTKSKAFSSVNMPRGLNVLLQEMETMGIDTRLITNRSADQVRHNETIRLKIGSDVVVEQEGRGRGNNTPIKRHKNNSKQTHKKTDDTDTNGKTRKKMMTHEETKKHIDNTIGTLKKELSKRKNTKYAVERARAIIEQKGYGRNKEHTEGLGLLARLTSANDNDDRIDTISTNPSHSHSHSQPNIQNTQNLISSLKTEYTNNNPTPDQQVAPDQQPTANNNQKTKPNKQKDYQSQGQSIQIIKVEKEE